MPDTLPTTPQATAKDGDIGEGSYAGTQQYNTETKEFMAEQGKNVQKLAKDAATASPPGST